MASAAPGWSREQLLSPRGGGTLLLRLLSCQTRLAFEIPHQTSVPTISLKPTRDLAPWGGGARRVSVLDPVFLAQRRVSLARQQVKEGEQATAKEAGPGRFLPVIQQNSKEDLTQARPPGCPDLQLPACAAQPSGMGTGSLRAERAGKRHQVLMASRRKEVEAEVWHQYHAKRAGQHMERGQTSCRHLFEDPYRPPHLLRKAYAEKLKERLQEKESCQRPARQMASEGAGRAAPPADSVGSGKQQLNRVLLKTGELRGLLPTVTNTSPLGKMAVEIGIGTFAIVPVHATVGEDEVLPVERPVFQLSRFLKKFYSLKHAKTQIPDKTQFVQLDFKQIAAETHFRPEIVEQCVHETLLLFAEALQENKEVELSFKGIGILAVRKKVVSMTFLDECLLELDGTGNMLAALLGDPKMMRIVAFAGKNDFSRRSRDTVITLPRLAFEIPHQTSVPTISLKPTRDLAPWGGGARRVSVLDPVFLAQRRVSLARQQVKEGEQATAKEAGPGRFLPVIQQNSKEDLTQARPPGCPDLQLPACAAQPSGMGTGSLRAERAGKRHQVLMASRRKEVEAEVWHQYHAKRAGQHMERGQTSCRHLFEDPYRPPHLLRKAYAEKLKERLQEKESCQRPARQMASEGRAGCTPRRQRGKYWLGHEGPRDATRSSGLGSAAPLRATGLSPALGRWGAGGPSPRPQS
ncbi:uncharacterized protein LOC122152894 [Tyto alba]|uniref:uncharacterized protein LOC122152894 n=1 Tax=Tyto alba TaxID=56313 RepID=UPI001C679F73|nr:uncharacterized protein LOC122152894 [Tyto alba]